MRANIRTRKMRIETHIRTYTHTHTKHWNGGNDESSSSKEKKSQIRKGRFSTSKKINKMFHNESQRVYFLLTAINGSRHCHTHFGWIFNKLSIQCPWHCPFRISVFVPSKFIVMTQNCQITICWFVCQITARTHVHRVHSISFTVIELSKLSTHKKMTHSSAHVMLLYWRENA